MIADAPNANALWSALAIEELTRLGVVFFCISPGSRSTPLTFAVAEHPNAQTRVCTDERGAAFHALGYARATGKPAALICTSGTALANYAPAIVEAAVDCVPLLVLSADRPPELRDSGANQTIDQPTLFGEHCRWRVDLPCPSADISPRYLLTTIDQAHYRTLRSPAGPVHLNFMFREPLAPTPSGENFDNVRSGLADWQRCQKPFTRYFLPEVGLSQISVRRIAEVLESRNGLLVLGQLRTENERRAVRQLAGQLGWPVFADITSGCRTGARLRGLVGPHDLLLRSPKLTASLRPQVILQIGSRLTSKALTTFLRDTPCAEYILLANHPFRHDPDHRVSMRLETEIEKTCSALAAALPAATGKTQQVVAQGKMVEKHLHDYFSEQRHLSEPVVAYTLTRSAPQNSALFLASSMPIRDMDLFAMPDGPALEIAANRGASGIDGTIATAAGFLTGLQAPATLLIGDLAFLHDLNSLALLKALNFPLVIVVINNDGGGIFSFLPIAKFKKHFEAFFGTPHGLTFRAAAEQFGVQYENPKTLAAFKKACGEAFRRAASTIIEVKTERDKNVAVHKQIEQIALRLL